MHRRSILRAIPCDLKKLPIGALEAFVLSQVPGRHPVEEVAEATGLELDELLRVARRLVHLGALSVDDDGPKTRRPPARSRTQRPPTPPAVRPGARPLVPPSVVPVACANVDLRSLGFGPREGFVLSQIDGATSAADLVEITHMSMRELSDALDALQDAGVVDLGRPDRRPTKPPMARASKAPPRRASKAAPAPGTTSREKPAVELPEADRVRIAETVARIATLDHYATLGIARDADGKTIRRAYHALAAQFHPDRFFGKNLGPSRQPLDRIFARLTLAYETLSKKPRREAYDATLPAVVAVTPPRAPTQKPPPERKPTRRSMRAARKTGVPAAPAPVVAATPAPVAAPAPSPPAAAPSAPSAPDPLLALYAGKKRDAVQAHVDVFVRAAREALERDDVVAAANHYRLAVQNSDDPALRAALEVTDAKARARVRDASLAGARAAEQAGRWAEAGVKYARAHGAHPEAWIAERAAHAMRRDGTDLRRAAQLAEQAVLTEPHNALYRVTLGEIYLDAGLMARAAGEATRALALAPADPRAIALSKRVPKAR